MRHSWPLATLLAVVLGLVAWVLSGFGARP